MGKRIVRVTADDSLRALELLREAIETNEFALEISDSADSTHTVSPVATLVLLTSGSSGYPKRVELSTAALQAAAAASAARIGSGQWLLSLPINYIAGAQVLMRSIWSDTQPVVLSGGFSPTSLAEAISRMSATDRYLSLVPTQLRRIAQALQDSPEMLATLREFKTILLGGQQPDATLVQRLKDSGVPLVTSYGLTETCGGCIYDGVPLDGTSVRLDSAGVIELASTQLAEGLGPWFRTADLGVIENGKLSVLGRVDRVINSGGMKIALDLVEQEALQIPGVEDCCAVAIADADWGQRVGLLIAGAPEFAPEDWLRARLGVAAVPKRVISRAQIPRLESGKTDYQSALSMLLG